MFIFYNYTLEPKLLEEPFVPPTLVSLLKAHSRVETQLLALGGVFQVLCTELLKAEVYGITCGHQVIVVDHLKNRKLVNLLMVELLVKSI